MRLEQLETTIQMTRTITNNRSVRLRFSNLFFYYKSDGFVCVVQSADWHNKVGVLKYKKTLKYKRRELVSVGVDD